VVDIVILKTLITEQRNTHSMNLDQMSTREILALINREDRTIADAVEEVLPAIEKTVHIVYEALTKGGRLFYIGAGTSGRLGILEAVECPPTFKTSPEQIQAIIAGGDEAIRFAVEGAEDSPEQGANDLRACQLTNGDVVIGIAASGRTPYVIGALDYARQTGAKTIGLSANRNALISQVAEYHIEVVVGPEVLTGSTRMKAATAHKMILNMISTTTMVKMGKVYENLMVDLQASNQKLIERAKNIVVSITGATDEQAEVILNETNQEVKPAIVMIETGVELRVARQAIREANGFVREAIQIASRLGNKKA
jgi:N-acetylmuramic acid 6-phosphate etherase